MRWIDPPKGFSLSRHMDKIRAVMRPLALYESKIMSAALFEDLLTEISEHRRYKSTTALRNRLPGMLPPVGAPVDHKAILQLALFLFEHDAMLRRGKLEGGWAGIPNMWAVSKVVDVCRDIHTKPGGATRYVAHHLVLAGLPAGHVLTTNMSLRLAAYLPKMLGVPSRTPKRVLPNDAIGMVLFGQWGTDGGKVFAMLETKVSSSFKTHNKQLFNRRNP